MDNIKFFNECNMEVMARYPDGYFDLVIGDFQYGINVGKMAYLQEVKKTVKQKNGTRLNGNAKKTSYAHKEWDNSPPPQAYFNELQRISKHQILFGIEYVQWEGVGPGRIKWNKGIPEEVSFKSYEMAYCSLIDYEFELPLLWSGMQQAKSLSEPMTPQGNKQLNEKRIHPTQKPVLLYKGILKQFATPDMKILDTHGGSMSIAIALHDFGIAEAVICEIDQEYFEKGVHRYHQHRRQLDLFREPEAVTTTQDVWEKGTGE